jgi:hypothetical protein
LLVHFLFLVIELLNNLFEVLITTIYESSDR